MHKRVVIATATLLGSATARIVGLAAPAVIAPSSNITVTLVTENYIQSVADISVAFGLSPQQYPDVLGVDLLGSFYLGPTQSNVLTNLTFSVSTPPSIDSIRYLTGVVTSLYGASHTAVSTIFYVPVTPGNATSTVQNIDYNGINACSTSIPTSTATSSTISTSTAPDSGPTCFVNAGYGDIQTLIQQEQTAVLTLLNDVAQERNTTAQADLARVHTLLDEIYSTVDPSKICGDVPPSTWPPLSPADSKVRAEQILQQVQDGLQELSSAAIRSDCSAAVGITCQLRQLVSYVDSYWQF